MLNKAKLWFLPALIALAACFCTACGSGDAQTSYLIKVGDIQCTKQDFKRFWEAYAAPLYANADMGALDNAYIRQTKQDAFDQFVVTALLDARAADLGISISNEELEEEVARLREDYSEDAFREALLKSAMPFELWRDALKRRLLLESVMRADLYARGEITADDVLRYGGLRGGKTRASATEVLERVYRAKAENDFKAWIQELQSTYKVEVNYDEWTAVLSE